MLTKPVSRRSPSGHRTPSPSRGRTSAARLSAANDRYSHRNPVPRVGINPRRFGRYGRIALRGVPLFRLAANTVDLYDILSGAGAPEWQARGSWTKYASCGFRDPSYTASTLVLSRSVLSNSSSIANQVNGCSKGFTPSGPDISDLPSFTDSFAVGGTKIISGSERAQAWEGFTRNGDDPFKPLPELAAGKAPIIVPPLVNNTPIASAEPAAFPPGTAPALPPPVPLAQNPYWKAPNRETSNGPNPLPVDVVPNNWSVATVYSPSGRPERPTAPKKHRMQRPSGPRGNGKNPVPKKARKVREKEQKIKMPAAIVPVFKLMNFVTEADDFMDVLYNSLPEQYQARWKNTEYRKLKPTRTEKMRAIYDNAENIDFEAFVQNFISEQFQDYVYGQMGQVGGQNSQSLGRFYGAGQNTIQRKSSRSFYDVEQESKNRVDGEQ